MLGGQPAVCDIGNGACRTTTAALAQQAAELWRFIPRAFKKYYNTADPAAIQQQAASDIPIDKILAEAGFPATNLADDDIQPPGHPAARD